MRDLKMHRRTCDSRLNLTENDFVFVLIVYRNAEFDFFFIVEYEYVCET